MPRAPYTEEERKAIGERFRQGRERKAAERAALAGSEQDAPADYAPSDAELGIGVEEPVDQFSRLIADPRVAELINAAVEARVKTMLAAVPEGPPGDQASLVAALVHALDKHSSAQAYQQPGHIKPLSSEEIERRSAAYVEMNALIQAAAASGDKPAYLLIDDFFCDDVLWPQGTSIYWLGPPNIMMEPKNPIAQRVMAQMWAWIGEQTPIEDQVADAWAARPRNIDIPSPATFREQRPTWQSRVEQIPGVMRQQIGPNRVVGTIQPEFPAGSVTGPQPIPATAQRIGTVMPFEAPGPNQNF